MCNFSPWLVISDHGCGDGLIKGTWLLYQQITAESKLGSLAKFMSTVNENLAIKLAEIFRADVKSAKIIITYRLVRKIGYNLSV